MRVASGVYTIQCAAPTFSPAAGTYDSTQTVTISTTTGGATIRYTTNGTTPSSTVGTVYSSPVSISATATLQAIAYETGMANSPVSLRRLHHQRPADHRHVALVERRCHHRRQQRRLGDHLDRLQRQRLQCGLHPIRTARSRPTYVTNVYNGMPVVRFAGNSLLQVSALPLGTYTIAAVFKTTGNSADRL